MTDVHCARRQGPCERQWEHLESLGEDLRFCHACQLAVHRVTSQDELERLMARGKCVALVGEASVVRKAPLARRRSVAR